MLIELFVYVLLGLLLAWPLSRLLPWLASRRGRNPGQWQYLQPYVPADVVVAPESPDARVG